MRTVLCQSRRGGSLLNLAVSSKKTDDFDQQDILETNQNGKAGILEGRLFQVRQALGGVTVLELAVVMVIIGILTAMLLPVYSSYVQRIEQAKCLANLRNLYAAASGYLQANGSWPQIPPSLMTTDPKQHARDWVEVLKPYGAPHAVWICPTIQRESGEPMDSFDTVENYRIDYVPTTFNDNPTSPLQFARNPWFMEKGNCHDGGNLIMFADGSTASVRDLIQQ